MAIRTEYADGVVFRARKHDTQAFRIVDHLNNVYTFCRKSSDERGVRCCNPDLTQGKVYGTASQFHLHYLANNICCLMRPIIPDLGSRWLLEHAACSDQLEPCLDLGPYCCTMRRAIFDGFHSFVASPTRTPTVLSAESIIPSFPNTMWHL